ncbi:ABC transporter permease [Nocardia callitridis]|uniref:ABC transporter permease n=1 Tax=Nocardia callitridis TaxID=648753 RepID=A0ABP9L5M9_9NOCA
MSVSIRWPSRERLRMSAEGRVRALDVVAAVVVTLAALSILFAATGNDPLAVYANMFGAALIGPGLVTTMQQAVPVIGLGLALSFSFRAGQFNLGASGQFVLGGLFGTVVVLHMPGPGWLAIPVALAAAMVGGALLSSASAVLFTWLSAPVFATSLLLNFPVLSTTSYLIKVVLKDPASSRDASASIPLARRVGVLAPHDSWLGQLLEWVSGRRGVLTLLGAGLNWSLLVVLVIFAVCLFINARLPIGYETALIGLNPKMATSVGVRSERAILANMAIGGSIAGLMGILVVLGTHYRLIDGGLDGTGYPITALLVVMLARNKPAAVLLVGLLFTALTVGAAQLERDYGLSSYVSTIVQAMVVFLVSLRLTPRKLALRWGVRR